MAKLPFEKLDEKNAVKFEAAKLPAKQRSAYLKMVEGSIDRKYGDPLDFAEEIFKPFEGENFKSKRLREDLCHRNVLFNKKLDVMNDEFDDHIAALVAQLIFQQVVLIEQRKRNVIKIDGVEQVAREGTGQEAQPDHSRRSSVGKSLIDDE